MSTKKKKKIFQTYQFIFICDENIEQCKKIMK